MTSTEQEFVDKFYWQNGPCCAGCDWWEHFNSVMGECLKSAPVSGKEATDVLGISGSTMRLPAGHVMTMREHRCGDFKDDFDWSSLPLPYQCRVGAK